MSHQSDYNGSLRVNEYSAGDSARAPVMGNSYSSTRGTWRVGDSNNGSGSHKQNDMVILTANPGLGGYVQDGIGHTRLDATPLPLLGDAVNASVAKGVIVPVSVTNPNPIGASNYTSDIFSFHAPGTQIILTVNDGTELLTTGVADPGATLRSTLTILDSTGTAVAAGTEAASTLSATFAGILSEGDYYAVISSYGGVTQTLTSSGTTYNTTQYYDMGAYFLTGSGFAVVPEPGTIFLGIVALGLAVRRRRTVTIVSRG